MTRRLHKKELKRLMTKSRNCTDNINLKRTTITRKQKWEEKQLYGYFKRKISYEKTWTWKRNRNLKKETTAQNNAIRTNYVKAKIDYTKQNSKCRLCDDRDETINPILSKCSKLTQKQ